MKQLKNVALIVGISFSLLLLGASCEEGNSTVVGSNQGNTDITNVSFTVTQLVGSSSSLKASGTVKNTGSVQIKSPWYVECQFYADSTLTLKLGGNRTQISVPLEPGVETLWSITFSSQNIAEGDYPNFRVSNMRAYYVN
jgi:hypothetical protein